MFAHARPLANSFLVPKYNLLRIRNTAVGRRTHLYNAAYPMVLRRRTSAASSSGSISSSKPGAVALRHSCTFSQYAWFTSLTPAVIQEANCEQTRAPLHLYVLRLPGTPLSSGEKQSYFSYSRLSYCICSDQLSSAP